MQTFLEAVWFSIGSVDFTYGQVLSAVLFVLVTTAFYIYFIRQWLPRHFERLEDKPAQRRRIRRVVTTVFYLSLLSGLIAILNINPQLFANEYVTISVNTIIQAILILQIARIADWLISRIVVGRLYNRRDQPPPTEIKKPKPGVHAGRTVQFAVYIFAVILILTSFDIDWVIHVFDSADPNVPNFELKLSNILGAVLVIFIARLIAWVLTEIVLYGYYVRTGVDTGSQYAFNQILKYVVYVIAILIAFNELGIQTTLLLGGLAALLVGIGLGLQQTFNDFFSGIILLFERSVDVNDILNVDGLIGRVKKIGVRASQIETRDNITVVVPNSKLVTQNVINWSHEDAKARFWISVPVPYGTDTETVKEILLQEAKQNSYVLESPAPFIRMVEFADSALLFELHFWSRSFLIIEDVKSDLRMTVNEKLIEQDIHIPFPQRDLWIRSRGPE